MSQAAEDLRQRSRSPSRPPTASRPQTVESLHHNVHANSLEPPSRQQSTQWDSAEGNNPGQAFSYNPSFQDSYTPYGSPGAPWDGVDAGQIRESDGLGDSAELQYNPADFDGHSGIHSPFLMLDGDIMQNGQPSRIPADFLSATSNPNVDSTQVHSFPSDRDANNNFLFTEEPSEYASGAPNQFASLHPRSNSAHFDGRFSPRPDQAPSPASSAGYGHGEQERFARSRASSVSSLRHASPAVMGHIGEALDRLAFDPVESDLAWRNQQQPKANSPPQLLIPSEPQLPNPNSLQIPSFGQPTLGTGPSFDGGMGGLAAPSINLLPATPVSGGGAGSSHVPFQQVLRNLNEQRKQGSLGDHNGINGQSPAPVPNSFANGQSTSRPSTPGHHQGQSSVDFSFPSNSSSGAFSFPHNSPTPPVSTLGQGLAQFFAPPRTRSYSDASRPQMPSAEQHNLVAGLGAPHPSIAGSYSPSMGQLVPPHLSAMGRNIASNRSSPFSNSSDSLPLQYSPIPPPADLGMGMPSTSSPFDTGLVVGQRHRMSRSEDFNRGSPFAPPPGQMLQPNPYTPQYGYAGHDSVGIPSSIGPTRTSRRGSSSSHHERAGSSSSIRPSPYPSPSGSPALLAGSLPNSAGLSGPGNGENPWSKVERQQVTTPATAKASEGRRKGEASFVCPVPGCNSTFTRHFNLKGHLRSHNEERPFKCKWPGCEKGFARQHDCKRHEALHLNLRPYTCDGCKKTFARMDALNRHLKSEGGVDCARQQGPENTAMFNSGIKSEYAQDGWPAKGMRMNSALAM